MQKQQMLRFSAICTLFLLLGCSGGSKQAWQSAGGKTGWYGPHPHGFSDPDEKPDPTSLEAYWCSDFDFAKLGTLSEPTSPFALHFGGSSVSDGDLAKLHRYSSNLYAIGLNNTSISDSGIVHLGALTNLRSISLSSTSVTNECISTLSKLPHLETLYLSFSGVTDEGIDSLTQSGSLRHLDLSATRVTDNGLRKLSSLSSLQYLGIARTETTLGGVSALKKRLPNLVVE